MNAIAPPKPSRASVSVLLVFFVFFMPLAATQAASGSAGAKIGYVDIDRIAQESTFIRAMMGDLEKTLTAKREKVEHRQDDLTALRAEIDRKRAVVSESDLEEMNSRSRRLRNEIDDESSELNRMLRQAEKERMEPALDRILEIIRAIGKEEGFDLILRGEVVLYGSATVDITEKVIKRLDREAAAAAPAETGGAGAKAKSASKLSPKRAPSVAGDDGAATGVE